MKERFRAENVGVGKVFGLLEALGAEPERTRLLLTRLMISSQWDAGRIRT